MASEIEHKFLVTNNDYKHLANHSTFIRQGYLSIDKERVVRVRTRGDKGYITIKGKNSGAFRLEFEYSIPIEDANEMIDKLCHRPIIEKVRHIVNYAGNDWEIDEFKGCLDGLVVAELEMPSIDYKYDIPPFVGKDVTNDSRYYNSNLIDTIPSQD